jgi:hypothetical protein
MRVIAEIVSLSGYESQVSALLDEEERMAMEFYIACTPEDHPVIPGAGGFRKARWARRGKGKGPRKNNFSATGVAQSLTLPRPDSSGRALEHAQQASR